jgi:hypothetical protein
MYKRISLLTICFVLVILCHLACGNPVPIEIIEFEEELRPEEPEFPIPSLRVKALGENFLGIVSDIESDILLNSALLPLLKSNYINLSFLPYADRYGLKYPIAFTFFAPKIFNTELFNWIA